MTDATDTTQAEEEFVDLELEMTDEELTSLKVAAEREGCTVDDLVNRVLRSALDEEYTKAFAMLVGHDESLMARFIAVCRRGHTMPLVSLKLAVTQFVEAEELRLGAAEAVTGEEGVAD